MISFASGSDTTVFFYFLFIGLVSSEQWCYLEGRGIDLGLFMFCGKGVWWVYI
jgi:hypothetical protein